MYNGKGSHRTFPYHKKRIMVKKNNHHQLSRALDWLQLAPSQRTLLYHLQMPVGLLMYPTLPASLGSDFWFYGKQEWCDLSPSFHIKSVKTALCVHRSDHRDPGQYLDFFVRNCTKALFSRYASWVI